MSRRFQSSRSGNLPYVSQHGLRASRGYVCAQGIKDVHKPHVFAQGGTETRIVEPGGIVYRVHTFTSSGTFNAFSPGDCEYLVQAGGGGGGGPVNYNYGEAGGSGGGGGTRIALTNDYDVSTGLRPAQILANTVTVGGGGPGGGSSGGSNGGDSSALGISATGGGKGGGGFISCSGGSGGNGGSAGQCPPDRPGSPGGSNAGGYTPSEAGGKTSRINGTNASYPGSYGGGGGGQPGATNSPGAPGGGGIVIIRYPIG